MRLGRQEVIRRAVRGGLPLWSLVAVVVALLVVPRAEGDRTSVANGYDIAQNVGAVGLLALALALTMIAGEFDLSVPGAYLLGSMVAVLTGGSHPTLGVLAAIGATTAGGLIQGVVVAKRRVNSMSVTLGGFLVLAGIVYVISGSQSKSYANFAVGTRLVAPVARVFSIQSLVVLAIFAVVAAVLRATKLGPALRAVGSDRRAARTAGVRVDLALATVLAVSGGLAGLAGSLQGYALGFAAPGTSTDSLVFAATAALLGGVRLSGGVGTIAGVLAGVVTLSVLEELLVVVSVGEYITNLVTGGLLVLVALVGAPELLQKGRSALGQVGTAPPAEDAGR
jgi:ribose/xylose/arabinose/galactoside ABC-type transport system permease subunit